MQKTYLKNENSELMLQKAADDTFYKKLLLVVTKIPPVFRGVEPKKLYISFITTPLGDMVAISDHAFLYLLEFADRKNLESRIIKLRDTLNAVIECSHSNPMSVIKSELELYFAGKLISFKTPIKMIGTPFQQQAWAALLEVPYAQTLSYKSQACAIGKTTAYRAVANANSCNHLAIIIPCHRIINSNGELGGYAGTHARKKWLLEHEESSNS